VNTKADATKYQHSAVHCTRLQGSNIWNLELSIQYAKLESTLKPVKREISNNLIVSLHFYSLVLRIPVSSSTLLWQFQISTLVVNLRCTSLPLTSALLFGAAISHLENWLGCGLQNRRPYLEPGRETIFMSSPLFPDWHWSPPNLPFNTVMRRIKTFRSTTDRM